MFALARTKPNGKPIEQTTSRAKRMGTKKKEGKKNMKTKTKNEKIKINLLNTLR